MVIPKCAGIAYNEFDASNAEHRMIRMYCGLEEPDYLIADLKQAFEIIAMAEMTIGVDTGLTHLSAVMNKPTIEIYCDSPRWKTEGNWSPRIINLGDAGAPPDVAEAAAAALALLDRHPAC